MGYRSQVVFAVDSKLMNSLLVKLSQCPKAFDLLFKEAERESREDGSTLFELSDIKWYDANPAVATLEDWMLHLDEESFDDSETDCPDEWFRFVRLGEEFGDCEDRGYYDGWHVYPEQRICIS